MAPKKRKKHEHEKKRRDQVVFYSVSCLHDVRRELWEVEAIQEPIEPEPEKIVREYTDTSYTSASLETPPPAPPPEEPKKKKRGKKKDEEKEVVRKSSSEIDWSAESLPQDEIVEEQEVVERKPKKKGKKGKQEPVEEIPDFEKPKKWKTMNKKEKDTWLAARIEEWKIEKEQERLAALAGAKEKKLRLARERAELMAKDTTEQEVRRDILQKTVKLFMSFERKKIDFDNKRQAKAEWQQYLRCDGLPDPRVVTQMSTYLNRWREEGKCDADQLERRCKEAVPMLEMLEEFVANSRIYTARQAENYNMVRLALRGQLSEAIDCASYWLLRDVLRRLHVENIKLATYNRKFLSLRLNMWVAIPMPTKLPHPDDPPPEPIELSFPALSVGVKLPAIVDHTCICVRAARTELDLLSERTRSYPLKVHMPLREEDLFTFNAKEFIEVAKLKRQQDIVRSAFYKETNAKIREIEAIIKLNPYIVSKENDALLEQLQLMEPPFQPDPRTFFGESNEKAYKFFLKKNFTRTRPGEMNMRKYRITGGVLNLDLLEMAPQPKLMEGEVEITTLMLPKMLKPLKYQIQYRAPAPPPPGVTRTPEEIEAEMKKIEAEYEKLALVTIDLSPDIMWFEPPVVCQWQEARKLWTSNYINDYKFNEDKLNVQFRTGILWPIGLATLKYSNVPYQGWDIKPDPSGKSVTLVVTGVIVTCTWTISGSRVKLKFVANSPTPALKAHYNKGYSVKKMVKVMRDAACDFFPDLDGHSHIEGSCPKESAMERHLYHAMAYLSLAYNFQWSKWNVEAGFRNIVIQFREAVDKKREEKTSTGARKSTDVAKLACLHVSPQRVEVLKINEHATEFSLEPDAGFPFFPDLFTMNMKYASITARRTVFGMDFKLVETVFAFLQELKLCSFS